jgi:hypothetical protein
MIGSQPNLRPSGGNMRAFPVQGAQPSTFGQGQTNTPAGIAKPQYIDINTTEDAVNNVMAKGYQQGDSRYQMKQLDRAGISRGKGQQFIAGQEGAQALGTAAAQSAEMRMADAQTNAQMKSDYEKAVEQQKQGQQMLDHSRSQSDWSRQFALKSAQAQIRMAQQQASLQMMLAMMRD